MSERSGRGTTYRGDTKLDVQLRDPQKAVGSCDGYFEPENRQPHGPMRPGKTRQDSMPKEDRPRYQSWLKGLGR